MERAIFIDKDKCVGCQACIVACKLEHSLPPYPTQPVISEAQGPQLIRVFQIGPEIQNGEVCLFFQPISCMHCADAPCIRACPRSAIYKDSKTSVTLVDRDKCIGCKFCLWVCPYGAPQFYEGKMILCDLCIHRLEEHREKGRQTACEAACPARAIYVGTPTEISLLVGEKMAQRAIRFNRDEEAKPILP